MLHLEAEAKYIGDTEDDNVSEEEIVSPGAAQAMEIDGATDAKKRREPDSAVENGGPSAKRAYGSVHHTRSCCPEALRCRHPRVVHPDRR